MFLFIFFPNSWSLDGWFRGRLCSLDGRKGCRSGRHFTICALIPQFLELGDLRNAWIEERLLIISMQEEKTIAESGAQPCCSPMKSAW